MFWTSRKRRLPLTVAVLAAIIVIGLIFGHTHPARPRAGATYTGTVVVATPAGRVVQQLAIAFAVTRSSRRVSAFRFPEGIPSSCGAARLGRVGVAPASAPLEHANRFEVNLALTVGADRVGTLEIAGTFDSLGRESGAVSARYSSPRRRGCDASGGYNARATTT